jgi:hypothetical protein
VTFREWLLLMLSWLIGYIVVGTPSTFLHGGLLAITVSYLWSGPLRRRRMRS